MIKYVQGSRSTPTSTLPLFLKTDFSQITHFSQSSFQDTLPGQYFKPNFK